MAEVLTIRKDVSKEELYEGLLPQIRALVEGEPDLVANLANVAAILMEALSPLWVGFYILKDNHLVLGPFQGPLACTRIPVKPVARGVCGITAEKMETLIVPDVEKFDGHIACSSQSRSEIVVPLVHDNQCRLVLDIDSIDLAAFDAVDARYLEEIVGILKRNHYEA